MFRGENARLRGIDPQNIVAFRNEARFDVAVPEAHGRFRLPADFGAVKERHLALQQEWRRMEEANTTSRRTSDSGAAPAPAHATEAGRQSDA